MRKLKQYFIKLLSFGIYPEMEEPKKIAIQIASFDAISSLITFVFCLIQTYQAKLFILTGFHVVSVTLASLGILLIRRRYYDSGRILLHYVGLVGIFLSVDGLSFNSGYEFYYLAPLIVPFLTFTPEELLKSVVLSSSGLIVLIIQYITGPGLFSPVVTVSLTDKIVTTCFLFTYIIGLFSISRWQNIVAQEKIKSQQNTLIHINNIAALGIMSGGIAHEINNPLQILSIRIYAIKKLLTPSDSVHHKILEHVSAMESTISRIAKIVKGLKSLSRNVSSDNKEIFSIKDSLDDVFTVCEQKLKENEILLEIKGQPDLKISGHMIQFSQVIINLLNNSVDALEPLPEKWIRIEVAQADQTVRLRLTDSGKGIPQEILEQVMNPFFTTKNPGKGTGLGLSISKNIIEKTGGRLYYDKESSNTSFVIEMPMA